MDNQPIFILNFYSGSRIIMRSRVKLPVFISGPRSGARARISSFFQYSIFFSRLPEFSSTSRFSQNCQPFHFFPLLGSWPQGNFSSAPSPYQSFQFRPASGATHQRATSYGPAQLILVARRRRDTYAHTRRLLVLFFL